MIAELFHHNLAHPTAEVSMKFMFGYVLGTLFCLMELFIFTLMVLLESGNILLTNGFGLLNFLFNMPLFYC